MAGSESAESESERRDGDRRAEITEAWFEDEQGVRAEVLPTQRPCTFVARARFLEEIENPLFGIDIQNSHRDHVMSASNVTTNPRWGSFAAGEEVLLRIRFDNVLAADRYHVTPSIARQGGAWIDRRERMLSIVVTGPHHSDALLDLPFELSIERSTSPARAELIG